MKGVGATSVKPSNLQPYPAYKPSGVDWLGDVPEHWSVRRTKTVLRERSQKGFPDEPLLAATQAKGVVRKEQYENRTVLALKDLHLLKLVKVGDFVISLRSFQGGIEYAREEGIISPAYTVLYPTDPSVHAYLALLFKSKLYIDNLTLHVTGIRQGQNIDYAELNRSYLPRPPLPEQRAIVRYLDYVDLHIRRYVSAKERLIFLLEEAKQAVINRAVTRGLDPNVPLKPSGVEWLGDVPAPWEIRRLSQASAILRGKFMHRPRNDPSLYDGPYPFIQTGDIASASKTILEYRQTLNERGLAVSTMFPKGTLVMTIAANIGDVATLNFDACFPDSVVGFFPNKHMHRDHLYYSLLAMKRELLREAPVNTQGNLNVDRIGSRKLALPPLIEQAAIVQYLDKATSDIDASIDRARRQIELIQEYRTRLIADVVTGKLDVRAAAARLPNETDDRDPIDESGRLAENVDGSVRDANEAVGELATAGEVTV